MIYKIDINIEDYKGLQIELSGGSCAVIDDTTLSDGYFNVSIPADCNDKEFCIKFSCSNTIFDQCYTLCDDNTECDACEECVGGLCVKKCEYSCINGTCVDCIDSTNCSGGKICVNNICYCPSGLIEDEGGTCVQCNEDTDCGPCSLCQNGECIPLLCPCQDRNCEQGPCLRMCNPYTNECVECVLDSDCEFNEQCLNGECVCAQGYERIGDECVPIPNCDDATPCPSCYVCVDGNCQPTVCPNGFICVNGNCVPICTDNSDCPTGACTNVGGINVCLGCTGICTNDLECAVGCQCLNGICTTTPEPPPPCTTFSECPEGQGCYNGYCHPCEELSGVICQLTSGCVQQGDDCVYNPCSGFCDDSTQCADGCTCINNTCQRNPCNDTPCVFGEDCADGCGCLDGTCVPCNSVSCAVNIDCPNGCFCNDGTCDSNPCENISCNSSADCGEGCTCINGTCTPCDSIPCDICDTYDSCACVNGICGDNEGYDPTDCLDNISLVRGDCSLIGSIETSDCCGCPVINIKHSIQNVTTNANTTTFIFNSSLFLNGVLLSATGISNVLPLSGGIKVRTVTTIHPSTIDGILTGGSATTQVQQHNLSFINSDTASHQFIVSKVGTVVQVGIDYFKVLRTEIFVENISNFTFPNTCLYRALEGRVYDFVVPITIRTVEQSLTRLTACRPPLLTLYRGISGDDTNTKVTAKYTTSIEAFSPDVIAYRYYRLTSDCGCATETFYSCNGTAPTRLVYCDIEGQEYTNYDNCNRIVTFVQGVRQLCDIMFTPQAQYRLVINGTVVHTFTTTNTGVIIPVGYSYTHPVPINTLSLVLVGDDCNECVYEQTPPIPVIAATLDIADIACSGQYATTATIGAAGITYYQLIINGVVFAIGNAPATINVPAENGTWVLNVSDGTCANSITVEKIFTATDIVVSAEGVCDGDNIYIQVETSGVISLSIPELSYSASVNGVHPPIVVPQGTFTLIFDSENVGCQQVLEVTVDCCTPNPLTSLPLPTYTCENGLSLPAGIGLSFTINGVIVNNGYRLLQGTHVVTISNGVCQFTRNVVVGQCYECVGVACLPVSGGSLAQGYTSPTCNSECVVAPVEVEIEYSCTTGFTAISEVPATFYIGENLIAQGSIIDAGEYTVTVIADGQQFSLPLEVQQCKVCDPNCEITGCEVLQRSQFIGDVNYSWPGPMDDPISITKFNQGGTWTGLVYTGGANFIGTPLALTVEDKVTPDVILEECPCTGPVESCFNCNEELNISVVQERAWQNALNGVAVNDFLFETVQCAGVVLVTYPTCFSWIIETTYYEAPNYYIVTNGYDSVSNTVINEIEGFGSYAYLNGLTAVSPYGCGNTDTTNTEVIDLSCCIDAVPNIGLEVCPEYCVAPEPPPSCTLTFRLPNGLVLGGDSGDVYAVDLLDVISGEVNHLDTTAENSWSEVDHSTYTDDLETDLTGEGYIYDSITVSTNDNPTLTIINTNFNLGYWEGTEDTTTNVVKSFPYTSCERLGCIGFEYPPEGTEDNFLQYIYAYTPSLINQSADISGLDFSIEGDRDILRNVIQALVTSVGETYDEVIVEWDGTTLRFAVKGSKVGLMLYGLGHSASYNCPEPPEPECVCLSATIYGRNVAGLETNDGTQLLEEDGFSASYVLSSGAQRTLLQSNLQDYYDGIDTFPCTPEVEVTYDGDAMPSSTSTITLNCIPPDNPKALKIWEVNELSSFMFEEQEECECEIRTVCETQEVFVTSTFPFDPDCNSEQLNVEFSGNVTAVTLVDFPAGLTLDVITEDTPTAWNIIFTDVVLSGSYTISFTDERDCVYYHTFNIDCAGCTPCDFSLHGAGRLYGVVIDGATYNLGANVGVECSTGSPVFTPNQAAFEAALSAVLVNEGDCGTFSFEYTCENGTAYDTNNCIATNLSIYPYTQWVKVTVTGSGLPIEGAVWNFPSCTVPLEEDYCCQQGGCNEQVFYGAGKMNSITVGATVYNLLLEAPPIDDATAQCEAYSNLEGVRAAFDFVHTEEAAPLTYCIEVECFPFEEGLDPNNCYTTTPNQDLFMRIRIINSSITIDSVNWTGTGYTDCESPVVNPC